MSIASFWRNPRLRRGIAASAVVLAVGGGVLFQSATSRRTAQADTPVPSQTGTTGTRTTFKANGLHGSVALSHGKLLAGAERRMFVELSAAADPGEAREREPLAIAVVLDTSGSMSGEKIARAKDAVQKLVRDMSDADQVALIQYDNEARVVQPLARVGDVRRALLDRVDGIRADGGTNIPAGLQRGLDALEAASPSRARRVVLVSDGLDEGRAAAERLASRSFERGIVVSSLGIGVDFNESYMGGVARSGHGNFAFVENADTLATFLARELKETSATTIRSVRATLSLPPGMRLVRAHGAEARQNGRSVEITLGSLFAGDERRAIVELATTPFAGESASLQPTVSFTRVAGGGESLSLAALTVTGTSDAREVQAALDPSVYADATSVLASARQIEAAEAYARGDQGRAARLIEDNVRELDEAIHAVPRQSATVITEQRAKYEAAKGRFDSLAPTSPAGKAAAKQSWADDNANLERKQ